MTDAAMTARERAAEQTEIRRRLLENGYVPLANVDKRCMLKGWPTLDVDHDVIDDWSARQGLAATGLRMDGDLVALDFDIDDEDALDAVWDAVEAEDEDLFERLNALPLRAGKGAKVCLFGRLETGKVDKLWSKAYYAPGARAADPDGAVLQRLEVFTGAGTGGARQIGVYGAHSYGDDGEVAVAYRWADGIGLADIPRDALPTLRRKDVFALVDIVSKVLDRLGWEYEVSAKHGKVVQTRSLTLLPTMRFCTNWGDVMSLDELEAVAGTQGLRVSLSFCEPGARNVTRGLVGVNPADGRVQIWDTATATLYRPADLSVADKIGGIGAGLKKLGLLSGFAPLGARLGSGPQAALGGVDTSDCPDVEWEPDMPDMDLDSGAGAGADADEAEEILVGEDGRCLVPVGAGELARATWLIARWLAAQDGLYRRGGMVTRVVGGSMVMMSDARLSVEIGEQVMCAQEQRAGGSVRLVEVDPPPALVRQVGSVVGEVGFRDLRGVVDVPVVRRDGSMLLDDGWDRESGLLVQAGGRFAGRIGEHVSRDDALKAVDVLMRPFRAFPVVGAEGRGALLAALLTAVVRPSLTTAPAFALDAPAAGSGKTLLASCLMALGGGGRLYAPLPVKDESEVSKVLLSVLVEKPKVALFDNQTGLVDSASLAAVLTSGTYSGRILGSTRVADMDTNLMILFSGNNLTTVGDMTRRVVTVRIDADCEAPSLRRFDFDPLQEVVAGRDDMIVAALTLVKWAFRAGVRSRGRVGSFEMWDEIVGQTVAALGLADFTDPVDVLKSSQGDDPRLEESRALLAGLQTLFGNDWFKAADVVEAVTGRVAGHSAVASVLQEILPRGPTSIGVGRLLRFRRDTRSGDLRLLMRAQGTTKAGAMFRVAQDGESSVVEFGSFRERKTAAKTRIDHLKT